MAQLYKLIQHNSYISFLFSIEVRDNKKFGLYLDIPPDKQSMCDNKDITTNLTYKELVDINNYFLILFQKYNINTASCYYALRTEQWNKRLDLLNIFSTLNNEFSYYIATELFSNIVNLFHDPAIQYEKIEILDKDLARIMIKFNKKIYLSFYIRSEELIKLFANIGIEKGFIPKSVYLKIILS